MNAQKFSIALQLGNVSINAWTWENSEGEDVTTMTYSDTDADDEERYLETDNIPANTIVYIIHAGMMNGASVILQKMREHGAS